MLDDFRSITLVGRGGFGSIYRAVRRSDSNQYAIKMVEFKEMSAPEREESLNEIRFLASFRHPYIIKYYDSFFENDKLYIVMEFAQDGDLGRLLKKNGAVKRYLPESRIWSYFLQILLGVHAMHKKQVIHRDIKSRNIFLCDVNHVCLGDLGCSKHLCPGESAHTKTGTPYYMSPELVQGRPYGPKSDVWSLGVVLYEMVSLEIPFSGKVGFFRLLLCTQEEKDLYHRITTAPVPKVTHACDPDLSFLIGRCLSTAASALPSADKSPSERASADDLLESPSVQSHMRLLPVYDLSSDHLPISQRIDYLQRIRDITLPRACFGDFESRKALMSQTVAGADAGDSKHSGSVNARDRESSSIGKRRSASILKSTSYADLKFGKASTEFSIRKETHGLRTSLTGSRTPQARRPPPIVSSGSPLTSSSGTRPTRATFERQPLYPESSVQRQSLHTSLSRLAQDERVQDSSPSQRATAERRRPSLVAARLALGPARSEASSPVGGGGMVKKRAPYLSDSSSAASASPTLRLAAEVSASPCPLSSSSPDAPVSASPLGLPAAPPVTTGQPLALPSAPRAVRSTKSSTVPSAQRATKSSSSGSALRNVRLAAAPHAAKPSPSSRVGKPAVVPRVSSKLSSRPTASKASPSVSKPAQCRSSRSASTGRAPRSLSQPRARAKETKAEAPLPAEKRGEEGGGGGGGLIVRVEEPALPVEPEGEVSPNVSPTETLNSQLAFVRNEARRFQHPMRTDRASSRTIPSAPSDLLQDLRVVRLMSQLGPAPSFRAPTRSSDFAMHARCGSRQKMSVTGSDAPPAVWTAPRSNGRMRPQAKSMPFPPPDPLTPTTSPLPYLGWFLESSTLTPRGEMVCV